jgi:hypothetical protein
LDPVDPGLCVIESDHEVVVASTVDSQPDGRLVATD